MRRELRGAPIRVSSADRSKALAQVDAMAQQGLIRGADELAARRRQISQALYRDEIQAALANLPETLKPVDLPASDADRQDAVRQIRHHESVGHLTSEEADERVEIIRGCRTRDSIAAVLIDLPDVGQARAPRRISQRDRSLAIEQLDDAYYSDRITKAEHTLATEQVARARTRQEVNVAFRGLANPTVGAARKKAAVAGRAAADVGVRAVAEGGRRAGVAFLRWLVAVAVVVAGIVAFVAGATVIGWILLAAGVGIWVSSVVALFTSRHR